MSTTHIRRDTDGSGPGDPGADDRIGRVIWLVTRREIVVRIRSKAFRIVTALLVLGLSAFVVVAKVTGSSSPPSVAFTTSTAALEAPLRAAAAAVNQGDLDVSTVNDRGAGERLVREGDVDAFVAGTPDAFRVIVDSELSEPLAGVFTAMVRQRALEEEISRLGGDPATVAASVSSTNLDVLALEPHDSQDSQRQALGIVTGILVYLSLLMFGPQVAQGVVEEKTSRIVELLLATVRPWQLMAGKVLGIGLLALGQLALLGVVGVGLGLTTGVLDLPASVATAAAAWALLWYLLGFTAYGLMFAAAGALVSRQEDAGGVTAPLIIMIIIPYIIGASVLPGDPDSLLVTSLALVPFFSPVLMPMIIALGAAAAWHVALALVLTVALLVVLVWLTGRIYGNAVTRSGTRVRLSDALRPT